MDSLKLIPSVFFDGIARVVPGATAIVAYLLLSHSTWSQTLERTIGPSFADCDAVLTAIGLLFITAYVVGQLIAPLAKLVQRIGEWKYLNLKWEGWRVKRNPKPMPEAEKDAYDFLRLYHKEAGSQCAKIRAEFTMYNGLVVIFLVSSVYYPLSSSMWDWTVLAILVGTTLATAIRGRTVRDTFNETVMKFVRGTAGGPEM
jgi:hypothetical protein